MPLPVPRRGPARVESLWAIGGFLTFTLAVVLVVEVRCPDWLDREYQVRRAALRERLREDPDRPVLLMIGSSRTVTAFMPERVGPLQDAAGRDVLVFNYSHLGAGPRLNLVQTRRALRDRARPSWLILEVNPSLLVKDYLPSRQASIRDVRALAKSSPQRIELLYHVAAIRATIVHRVRTPILEQVAPAFVTRPQRYPDPHILPLGGAAGWARVDRPTPEYREKFTRVATVVHKRTMENFRPAPYAAATTREVLALCRAERIRAVLVLTPEDTQFLSWYGPHAEASIQNLLSELRAEFDVPVVDARRWVPDDGFSDPHHVNLKGAELFTDRLTAEVLRPLVAGGHHSPGGGGN